MIDNYCGNQQLRKVPYKDFKGNDLYEGDELKHPICGSKFTIIYDESKINSWRAIYENGENLFLGLQVSRGEASK